MDCRPLTKLTLHIVEDVLDEIVTVLVRRNVNQWETGPIFTPLANASQIALNEFDSTNLETLLNHLGGKLIAAVLRGILNDMVDGAITIAWSSILAYVLNAPVAKLSVGNNVDTGQNLFNGRTLKHTSVSEYK